jgi:hypothetical protein
MFHTNCQTVLGTLNLTTDYSFYLIQTRYKAHCGCDRFTVILASPKRLILFLAYAGVYLLASHGAQALNNFPPSFSVPGDPQV